MDPEAAQRSPAEQDHARTDPPPPQQSINHFKPHYQNLECPRVSIVMRSPIPRTGLNGPGVHKASEQDMSHHIRRLSYAPGVGPLAATEHALSGIAPTNGGLAEPLVKHESPPQAIWQDASDTFAADAERDEQPGLASGSGTGSPAMGHDNPRDLQGEAAPPQDQQEVLDTRGEKQQPASIEAIKVRAVCRYCKRESTVLRVWVA